VQEAVSSTEPPGGKVEGGGLIEQPAGANNALATSAEATLEPAVPLKACTVYMPATVAVNVELVTPEVPCPVHR
jgi:hypothetical protein